MIEFHGFTSGGYEPPGKCKQNKFTGGFTPPENYSFKNRSSVKGSVCNFRGIKIHSSRWEEGGVMGETNNFNNPPEIYNSTSQEASHGNPPELTVQSDSCLK